MEGTVGPRVNSNNISLNNENVCFKTARVILNVVTNIFMVLTVFVSVLFSCRSTEINNFQLHIIFCVLGYQFFMCQGILVLSKYNSWTMFMKRRHIKRLHWILQTLALISIIFGSVVMINEKNTHFDTNHSILAICALVLSVLGFTNGSLLMNAHALSLSGKVFFVKSAHCLTGIGALFCATASLCFGFDKRSFRIWIDNDYSVYALMTLTWMFTLAVSLDFWIAATSRLCNISSK